MGGKASNIDQNYKLALWGTVMNKTIEAFVRGYLWFRVETENESNVFWTYDAGQRFYHSKEGPATFTGFHIFKGVVAFAERGPANRNLEAAIEEAIDVFSRIVKREMLAGAPRIMEGK